MLVGTATLCLSRPLMCSWYGSIYSSCTWEHPLDPYLHEAILGTRRLLVASYFVLYMVWNIWWFWFNLVYKAGSMSINFPISGRFSHRLLFFVILCASQMTCTLVHKESDVCLSMLFFPSFGCFCFRFSFRMHGLKRVICCFCFFSSAWYRRTNAVVPNDQRRNVIISMLSGANWKDIIPELSSTRRLFVIKWWDSEYVDLPYDTSILLVYCWSGAAAAAVACGSCMQSWESKLMLTLLGIWYSVWYQVYVFLIEFYIICALCYDKAWVAWYLLMALFCFRCLLKMMEWIDDLMSVRRSLITIRPAWLDMVNELHHIRQRSTCSVQQ